MGTKVENTRFIKRKAQELGFFHCGISKADYLEEEAPRLTAYLKNGWNGKMTYLENNFDKRLDPRILVPGAKSVVSLLFNYYPEERQKDPDAPKLSKYAYGIDYHFVIKDKLKEFFAAIQEEIGAVEGRVFTDSAPVLDKAWAKKSGLGWIGKNALLITPKAGSFHFIAELILDLELEYDGAIKDYCGTCTRCIDACPTDALTPYHIEARKCISYLTIELKDSDLPEAFRGKMENWMFGCDICQDVCPWNRFATPHQEPLLQPRASILEFSKADWIELTEEVYREVFRKSPVKRAKFKGLRRNIDFLFSQKNNTLSN